MSKSQRRLVERVIRVVDYQASPPQPDRCPDRVVVTILADYGTHSPGEVRRALEQAVEVGEVETNGEEYWLPQTS